MQIECSGCWNFWCFISFILYICYYAYSSPCNLTPPLYRVLIGLHLIFCPPTWPTCCNSPRKVTSVKYKTRQKPGFPIVTWTISTAVKNEKSEIGFKSSIGPSCPISEIKPHVFWVKRLKQEWSKIKCFFHQESEGAMSYILAAKWLSGCSE